MFKRLVQEFVSGYDIDPHLVEIPQNRSLGDFSIPCFSMAKELRKSPIQIAKDFAEKMQPEGAIDKIVATGPYLNVFISSSIIAKTVFEKVDSEGDKYGQGVNVSKTLLIEGWQPNTHKVYHVGHLRNELMSETVCSICEFGGYTVHRVSYKGDVGAHIAKRVRYYKKFDNSPIPQQDISTRCAEIYVQASLLLGSTKKDNKELHEEYMKEVHHTHLLIEQQDDSLTELIEITKNGCLKDIKAINDELGSTIDREYLESEVEQPGIEYIKTFLENGAGGVKRSEGAIIIDLEEYGLGVCVLLKSNGASLYSTKDIALAYLKRQEYDFDESIYIVATEQIHHFNQIFKTLDLVGFEGAENLTHLSYGMVELPSGKMSSRDGNIVSYYEFRDTMVTAALSLVESRNLDDTKKQKIANDVAFSAMKFSMLLQDSHKKIVFDFDKALSFDGETGPYLQYAYARASSVLRKASWSGAIGGENYSVLSSDIEKKLLLHLSEFPACVRRSADERKPNVVARYVLELAHLFSSFYQSSKILSDDQNLTNVRLHLVSISRQVLKNGLTLLGINVLEEM